MKMAVFFEITFSLGVTKSALWVPPPQKSILDLNRFRELIIDHPWRHKKPTTFLHVI
jgi:hypothetical protein